MKSYEWLILRDTLRASYWFIPTLMMGAAISLAVLTLALDQAGVAGPMARLGLGDYYGGPSGALTLLSMIAGSMLPLPQRSSPSRSLPSALRLNSLVHGCCSTSCKT